jgi:hypothetical protein
MTDDRFGDRVRRIIAVHRPALTALAHSDDGVPREGCDCPFCTQAAQRGDPA